MGVAAAAVGPGQSVVGLSFACRLPVGRSCTGTENRYISPVQLLDIS